MPNKHGRLNVRDLHRLLQGNAGASAAQKVTGAAYSTVWRREVASFDLSKLQLHASTLVADLSMPFILSKARSFTDYSDVADMAVSRARGARTEDDEWYS
jgi:hypothetical protein